MPPGRPAVKQKRAAAKLYEKERESLDFYATRQGGSVMASIDIGYSKSAPAMSRPILGGYRELTSHLESPAEETGLRASPGAPRPHYPRLHAGQLVRTAVLIGLCLGLSRLPHAERTAPVATMVSPKPL